MTGGAGIVVSALIVRLLRPSNLRALASGSLPALRSARFTALGQMIEVHHTVTADLEKAVAVLQNRADATDERIDRLAMAFELLLGGTET